MQRRKTTFIVSPYNCTVQCMMMHPDIRAFRVVRIICQRYTYIYILPAVSKAMEYILRLHWACNRLTELKFMHYLPAMLIISVKMFMRTKVCGYKFSCIGIQLQKNCTLQKFPIIGTIQPAVPTSNQAWVCTSPLNSQEEEEACVPHSLGISPEMEVTLRTDMNMVTCHGH